MTVLEQLNDMVSNYFRDHPNVSINALSGKSGVPSTTLRRIVHLSVKTEPAPHTVLNLVSALANEKNLKTIINNSSGAVKSMLSNAFGQYLEDDNGVSYDQGVNLNLTDKTSYFIYKLASNRCGTSEWDIVQAFGHIGLKRMEKMIEMGLIIKEGRIIRAKDKNFSMDIELASHHLPELVKFYKPSDINEGKNLLYSLSESLNKDSIDKIKEIQRDAAKEIYKIMNSESSSGEIPYFSLFLSDTMEYQKREVVQ